MLLKITSISGIDKRKFLGIYSESTAENAAEFFPGDPADSALEKAEEGFIEFLSVFFSSPGNTYWILEEDGIWVCAFRTSLISPGFYYLEALETCPDSRRRGYAAKLIRAVTSELSRQGAFIIRDCVGKRNTASVQTHLSCGFRIVSDKGTNYLDGTSSGRSYGMEYVFSTDRRNI